MKLGMMFPGQGSQSVGMLSELSASRIEVKRHWKKPMMHSGMT